MAYRSRARSQRQERRTGMQKRRADHPGQRHRGGVVSACVAQRSAGPVLLGIQARLRGGSFWSREGAERRQRQPCLRLAGRSGGLRGAAGKGRRGGRRPAPLPLALHGACYALSETASLKFLLACMRASGKTCTQDFYFGKYWYYCRTTVRD